MFQKDRIDLSNPDNNNELDIELQHEAEWRCIQNVKILGAIRKKWRNFGAKRNETSVYKERP